MLTTEQTWRYNRIVLLAIETSRPKLLNTATSALSGDIEAQIEVDAMELGPLPAVRKKFVIGRRLETPWL